MVGIHDVVTFFRAGGIFMLPILGILILGTAIVLDRLRFLSRARGTEGPLWEAVQQAVTAGNLEQALRRCEEFPGLLAEIYRGGLLRAQSLVGMGQHPTALMEAREELENAVEEQMLEALPRIERRIHYLPTLANVATLLGLLGTIMGLIRSFQAVALADPNQKAVILAQGISVAMNTTAFGLMVAIPLMLCYAYLQSRAMGLVDQLDAYSVKLINLLTTRPPRTSRRSQDGVRSASGTP